VDPAFTPERPDVLRVHDAEFEPELLQHLGAPFDLQRRRANDHDGSGPVADEEFLDHQSGFDGLPQTHVVGDQQIHAGHVDGTDERI
jgi:hypothetical protein